jgi:hypothetical protein
MDGVFENMDKKSNLLGLPFRTLDGWHGGLIT